MTLLTHLEARLAMTTPTPILALQTTSLRAAAHKSRDPEEEGHQQILHRRMRDMKIKEGISKTSSRLWTAGTSSHRLFLSLLVWSRHMTKSSLPDIFILYRGIH